jgi:hypothetical protein
MTNSIRHPEVRGREATEPRRCTASIRRHPEVRARRASLGGRRRPSHCHVFFRGRPWTTRSSPRQLLDRFPIAIDQRFLFGAGPTFDLAFCRDCVRYTIEMLRPNKLYRSASRGVSRAESRLTLANAPSQIIPSRAADVIGTIGTAQPMTGVVLSVCGKRGYRKCRGRRPSRLGRCATSHLRVTDGVYHLRDMQKAHCGRRRPSRLALRARTSG